jgi:hypothetical protein
LIIRIAVGGEGLSSDDSHDIVIVLLVEFLLLLGADNVIGRSNAVARIADNRSIEPVCLKRPDFHSQISLSRRIIAAGTALKNRTEPAKIGMLPENKAIVKPEA